MRASSMLRGFKISRSLVLSETQPLFHSLSLVSSDTPPSFNSMSSLGFVCAIWVTSLTGTLEASKGPSLERPIITASSVRIVRLPWKGQILTLSKWKIFNRAGECQWVITTMHYAAMAEQSYHWSKSFRLNDPGRRMDSSASTHSSRPATPPKTINACSKFGTS